MNELLIAIYVAWIWITLLFPKCSGTKILSVKTLEGKIILFSIFSLLLSGAFSVTDGVLFDNNAPFFDSIRQIGMGILTVGVIYFLWVQSTRFIRTLFKGF